jgi:hypothetical protein
MGIETLAIASLALGAVGTGVGAVGALQQGQAQAAAARYQAAVAGNAQKVAQWQAKDAIDRGKVAEQQRRTKTALQIGSQRAALASSGTDVNSGSNLDIIGDTAATGEFDALTIRSNAEREAWDKKVQGSNLAADAQLSRSRAGFAEQAGMLGAGANLIAGASSVSDKWLKYKDKILS